MPSRSTEERFQESGIKSTIRVVAGGWKLEKKLASELHAWARGNFGNLFQYFSKIILRIIMLKNLEKCLST